MNRLLVDLSDCAVRKAVLDLRRPADLRYLGDTLSALKRVGHMATRLVTLVIDNSVRLSRCVRTALFFRFRDVRMRSLVCDSRALE